MINSEVLVMNIFGLENTQIRKQYIWSHCFHTFLIAFSSKTLSYTSAGIPLISLINCNTKRKTETYAFVSLMFSESSLNSNQSVFEDLNIVQMEMDKTDNQWNNYLTIWQSEQKTEV